MFIELFKTVRLTYFLIFFFFVYSAASLLLPSYELSRPLLTLFSANSFLYGFYITPIVKDQNARISSLNQRVHTEATLLYAMALKMRDLPASSRKKIMGILNKYVNSVVDFHDKDGEEKAYEEAITYLVSYKGKQKDTIDDITSDLIKNQDNRTQRRILLDSNKVYRNEWIIMGLLFSTTIFFIMAIDTGDSVLMPFVKALICTGLTMLIVILAKASTLTHKRAKGLMQPMINLLDSHYYRID